MYDRKQIIIRDFFTCQTCGKPANYPQIAHKIKQGKGSEEYIIKYIRENYGDDKTRTWIKKNVINSHKNVVTTCSLECNDAQNIFFNNEKRDSLIDEIYMDILIPF